MTRSPDEPTRGFDDRGDSGRLPVLDRLGHEFARVAQQQAVSRQWWQRLGSAWLLSLVAVLGVSAVAVAAVSGVFGSPVSDPPGTPRPQPTVGSGVPRAGSEALTALRVADPAGGPPWGLRLTKTTREQGCVQVGRVVDGQLGVLGQDGQFNNDGRFHPLPLGVADQQVCTPLDAAGHAFVAVIYRGLPAAGRDGGCRGPDQPAFRVPPGSNRKPPSRPRCARANERVVYFGALGPQATAVRYRDAQGREQRAAASGPDGAYLVVRRPRQGEQVAGVYSPSSTPSSGLSAVEYRDGSECRIPNARRLGGGRDCPKRGFVTGNAARYTAAQVATPIQLVIEPQPRRPVIPGSTTPAPVQRIAHIRFTARQAAVGPAAYEYDLQLAGPVTQNNGTCRSSSGGPIGRDIRAGEQVDQELYLPVQCTGRITGEVRYRAREPALGTGNIRGGVLVGRFSAKP